MNTITEQEAKAAQSQAVAAAEEFGLPDVNILETPEAYLLEAEMPGVNKEGLTVSVEGDVLTLEGRRQIAADAGFLYRESNPGGFRRVFQLDPSIDTAKIAAKVDHGIVSITLPKAERAKPRKITVS
jgi:HSP20 family protein